MDRLRLESRQAIPNVSNFVVGLFKNDEIHLTPLKAIIHLRKSLSYLDLADKQAKATAKEQGLGKSMLSSVFEVNI
jgi:RPC5 protein